MAVMCLQLRPNGAEKRTSPRLVIKSKMDSGSLRTENVLVTRDSFQQISV